MLRFTRIDQTLRADHYYLREEDNCFFLREFIGSGGYSASETNQLIFNFKIKPSKAAANSYRREHKERAIRQIAREMREAIKPESVNELTFVPIPTSKVLGHADYCDRLPRTLKVAFHGLGGDIRSLLRQSTSTEADHESDERIRIEELRQIIEVDATQLAIPLRRTVIVFDDVLTSGKHFRVCVEKLATVLPPETAFVGLFVARRIRPDISAEFEVLDN